MENRQKIAMRSHGISIEVGSLILFALSVFTGVAILTYSTGDPSFLTNSKDLAHNACGKIGAYLSSYILQWFGLGGFLIPAAFGFLGFNLFKKEGIEKALRILGGMSVAVISLTIFLALQWKFWPYSGGLILTGGVFGTWLADFLLKQFNPLGSSLVSLLVFFIALVLSTPLSVAHLFMVIGTFVFRWFWRGSKLLGTYFAFMIGILAMKVAHAVGDLIQVWIEKALKQGKKIQKKEAQSIEAPVQRKEIPVESEVSTDLSLEGDGKGEEEDNEEEEEVFNQDLELDLADAGTPDDFKVPAILPPESQLELDEEIFERKAPPKKEGVAKVAQKLAHVAQRTLKKGQWKLPTVEFLKKPPKVESSIDRDRLIANSQILTQKFADFGIQGEVTAVRPGPVITLYEFKPGPGVKVSRIAALADDLSMALSAQSVRILAPLPGKAVVGIEIPSDTREVVYFREFLQNQDFFGHKHSIPVVMGKDIGGQTYLSDLARMPHLLCAGQTGSGKSVFMNGLICSLLYRFTPDELRMILVDPKFIEFRAYQDIPHLLLPVVDDPKQASIALKWAVREMERRYRILAKMGARNLASFNQKVGEMGADIVKDLLYSEENENDTTSSSQSTSGSDWIEAFEPDETGVPKVGKLPYIVVIIDELADLMMVSKKEVEISIARIAQKARAAGIHLVIATQRPSTDVITGLIKANLPSRVSFQLASYVDSKTILDRAGAERLLGQGDMLFIPPGVSQSIRLHGAYVDDEEISKITAFLKSQGKPAYRDEILLNEEEDEDEMGNDQDEQSDVLFEEAVELVKKSGHASASFLQRHLKVGYNRAARMIEDMECKGIVGPADGARPREILIR